MVKESTAYTSTADLAGKTVVAEAGSAGEAAIQGDENLAKQTTFPRACRPTA